MSEQDQSGGAELGSNPRFVMLPEQLMDEAPDPKIWAVFAVIYKKANGNSKGCFCSTETLSELSGVGVNSVRKCTQWLHANGYLKAIKRQDNTTIFYAYPFAATPHEIVSPPSRNHEAPPHETVRPPLTKSLGKQYPSNKIPLTRGGNAPASPDAPTPRDKRRNKAQEIQGWVESIPSEFAEYREEIQSWLEARWDQSSRTNYRDNPWGPKKNSLKALKLLAEHCPDKTRAWIEDAVQGGYTSLGYSGFREKIQRLASVGSNQPPQRRRQHLPDLAEELRRKGQL